MFRLSVTAFIVRLVDIPCGTAVVTRRQVSTFTCVDVLRTIKGLLVTFLVAMSPVSELMFCTVLVSLIILMI